LKNHLYPPFQEATVDIDYRKGIDPFAGIVEMALEAGIIIANPPWYDVGGGEKVNGKAALREYLRNDDSILGKLEEWIGNTGYSTVNPELEEAAKVFDVDGHDVIDTEVIDIE
jgi:hypothetical protein